MKRIAPLLITTCIGVALTTACSESAGGPKLLRLQVSVSSNGTAATAPECIRIPVLHGSRVQNQIDVDGQFTVKYDAVPEQVNLSFHQVENAETLYRAIAAETLEHGYAEELTVVTLDGEMFTVNLTSACQ